MASIFYTAPTTSTDSEDKKGRFDIDLVGGVPYILTHNFDSVDLLVQSRNDGTGELEDLLIDSIDLNSISISGNNSGSYVVIIFAI